MEEAVFEPVELARFIVNLVEEKKGEDIVLLDIRELSVIADYFIISTGGSQRQLKAMIEGIRQGVREEYDISPRNREGDSTSGWVLIDYADIVVHIFSQEARGFYELEDLWSEAPVMVKIK